MVTVYQDNFDIGGPPPPSDPPQNFHPNQRALVSWEQLVRPETQLRLMNWKLDVSTPQLKVLHSFLREKKKYTYLIMSYIILLFKQ